MKKRNLIIALIVIITMIVVFGANTAFASKDKNPWERIWKIFVSNWPENQKVTVTNTDPIKVEGISGQTQEKKYKTVTLGASSIHVDSFMPLENAWEDKLYASYQGKGKLTYMTVSGPNQVGVKIVVDGVLVANEDAFNLCRQWGQDIGNGWKCVFGDNSSNNFGALEVKQDYYFNEKIDIYLNRGDYTGPAGAHIELLVEE